MGVAVHKHQPCVDQVVCGSSDALTIYEDGSSFCFSCSKRFGSDKKLKAEVKMTEKGPSNVFNLLEIAGYATRGFKERGITKEVTEFYDVKSECSSDNTIVAHYYPYGVGDISAYKVRKLPKNFVSTGKLEGLFGQRKFPPGGKRLVITEGEIDAMVIQQANLDKSKVMYPTVSISGASNTKELLVQREWIRSFDEVVLWFDNDEPGIKAANEAAKIIGFDKVFIANSQYKDASDTYNSKAYTTVAEKAAAVIKAVWNAKKFSPAGIVSSANTWDAYKSEKLADYIPWPPFMEDLNKQIYGRRKGTITMITSGTGMGKTSWVKEDQFHLLKTTNMRIGVCSLEESIHEAVVNIMALEANKRIQLPDVGMTDEEELGYWNATMGDDRFLFLDHQGSVEDSSLVDKMEFMALSGCEALYLDHVTIAVSESGEGGTNEAIDKLMSDLLKLAKRHNVWICVVSHLRKTGNNQKSFEEGAVPTEDDLKGSGSLKQVPAQIFAVSRNKMEADLVARHTSRFWILKDRKTGRTGPAGGYIFGEVTGRLSGVNINAEFEAVVEQLT